MWGLREVKNQASTLGHEREPPVAKKSPSFCTNAHMCTREGNVTGPNRKSNTNDFHLVNPPIAMLTYMPGMFHCIATNSSASYSLLLHAATTTMVGLQQYHPQ